MYIDWRSGLGWGESYCPIHSQIQLYETLLYFWRVRGMLNCWRRPYVGINALLRAVVASSAREPPRHTWPRNYSRAPDKTNDPVPFLSSNARQFRLNNLDEIRRKRSYSLPVGVAMFVVLLYVFSMKEDKTKEDNKVTDFLFQDIRERYPEAADRLPENLTDKSNNGNSVAKNS